MQHLEGAGVVAESGAAGVEVGSSEQQVLEVGLFAVGRGGGSVGVVECLWETEDCNDEASQLHEAWDEEQPRVSATAPPRIGAI